MNAPENSQLVQKALRGELTPSERAAFDALLAADAKARSAFEEERALDQALGALAPALVSSNFTARVLQEVSRVQGRSRSRRPWPLPRLAWVPAGLTAALVLTLGGVFYKQRIETRQELAQSVAVFTEVTSAIDSATLENGPATLPVSVLQDFEAIERLGQMPREQELDMELFAALQR